MHAPMKFAITVDQTYPILSSSCHITNAKIGVDNCHLNAYMQKRLIFSHIHTFLKFVIAIILSTNFTMSH